VSETVRALLSAATVVLGGPEARREAEMLAEHALARTRAWLHAHDDDAVGEEEAANLRALVLRRAAGEPLAYIVRRREFFGLDLEVTPEVLIPRAETELLVEQALLRIPNDAAAVVADLGTGSGAIALAIAELRPLARVVAIDASDGALAVARRNAERLRIDNVAFAHGDWCAALPAQRFDMLVANPPYIAADDAHLAQGDLRFEPARALVSGHDGLDAIRAIAAAAPGHLRAGGWLLLEHGHEQGPAVGRLLQQNGFVETFLERDLEGRDRVSGGRCVS